MYEEKMPAEAEDLAQGEDKTVLHFYALLGGVDEEVISWDNLFSIFSPLDA